MCSSQSCQTYKRSPYATVGSRSSSSDHHHIIIIIIIILWTASSYEHHNMIMKMDNSDLHPTLRDQCNHHHNDSCDKIKICLLRWRRLIMIMMTIIITDDPRECFQQPQDPCRDRPQLQQRHQVWKTDLQVKQESLPGRRALNIITDKKRNTSNKK